LREQYQGFAPPVARTETNFDPGAKNHIPANVPYARYYLASIYQFQFYKAMRTYLCGSEAASGPALGSTVSFGRLSTAKVFSTNRYAYVRP